jgi:nucleoside-diphosphate-sugar epimerase
MAATVKHALIFGASGISGWSLLNQALQYPTPTTFNRVTGLCNRPFRTDDALLPDDDRLSIVSGIDLTQPVEVVKALLKEKINDVESVDVVFFCGTSSLSSF